MPTAPKKSSLSPFLTALRRLRSSNQRVRRDVAAEVMRRAGLTGHAADALHDTPHGSMPSVAVAAHQADPARLAYAAAWVGLGTRSPSLVVFQAGDGNDSVFKFHLAGGGDEVRKRLDAAGISQRTLLPTSSGFHVLVYDPDRRLSQNVAAVAAGSPVEETRGTGQLIGHVDAAKSRQQFRQIISQYETANAASAQPAGRGG